MTLGMLMAQSESIRYIMKLDVFIFHGTGNTMVG